MPQPRSNQIILSDTPYCIAVLWNFAALNWALHRGEKNTINKPSMISKIQIKLYKNNLL
jgi:hypothetical protein